MDTFAEFLPVVLNAGSSSIKFRAFRDEGTGSAAGLRGPAVPARARLRRVTPSLEAGDRGP